MAATVEHMVAKRVVGRIPAGSTESAAARSAITPVGSRVTLEVFMARNMTMESVAVPGCGLSLSSSCMALIPKGVAALPRPSALADIFKIIAPMAG